MPNLQGDLHQGVKEVVLVVWAELVLGSFLHVGCMMKIKS
jgi:hypothetical protein